ncbi:MAG TPA: hypothetical protein VF659_12385 [Pyrinomonadaceae bacterium]
MMALATGAFAFSGQTRASLAGLVAKTGNAFSASTPAHAAPAAPAAAAPQRPEGAPEIPQFAVYRQLFRHLVFLKEKAAEKEQRGENGASLRGFYRQKAKLDEQQAAALDRIATETDAAVTKLDERAKKITDRIRAQYPEGKLPAGQQPPPFPEELKAMQKQRNETILRGRDRLREALGAQEFERFDQYVQQNVTSRMKPLKFDHPRPELPGAPRLNVGPRRQAAGQPGR